MSPVSASSLPAELVAALLEIRQLSCTRDGRQLFRDLNLAMRAGNCVSLTGPNGSGKSTLLRCIGGLFPDYSGTIRVDTLEYLGHRPGVALALSPLENLRWYADLAGPARQPTRPDPAELLDRVGLAGYEDLLCQHLSQGQLRRVALARLMLGSGRLWLLDEPFTALDVNGQALVRALVVEHLQAGGAALCATHQNLEVPGSTDLVLGLGG